MVLALLASKLLQQDDGGLPWLIAPWEKEMKPVHQTIVDNEARGVASTDPLTDEDRESDGYGSLVECYYCGNYILKSVDQCSKCGEVQPR